MCWKLWFCVTLILKATYQSERRAQPIKGYTCRSRKSKHLRCFLRGEATPFPLRGNGVPSLRLGRPCPRHGRALPPRKSAKPTLTSLRSSVASPCGMSEERNPIHTLFLALIYCKRKGGCRDIYNSSATGSVYRYLRRRGEPRRGKTKSLGRSRLDNRRTERNRYGCKLVSFSYRRQDNPTRESKPDNRYRPYHNRSSYRCRVPFKEQTCQGRTHRSPKTRWDMDVGKNLAQSRACRP